MCNSNITLETELGNNSKITITITFKFLSCFLYKKRPITITLAITVDYYNIILNLKFIFFFDKLKKKTIKIALLPISVPSLKVFLFRTQTKKCQFNKTTVINGINRSLTHKK